MENPSRVIIVTGASRGIGAGIVRQLVKLDVDLAIKFSKSTQKPIATDWAGTRLIITARTKGLLDKLLEDIQVKVDDTLTATFSESTPRQRYCVADRVKIIPGNISELQTVHALVDSAISLWKRLDCLLVNHGVLDPVMPVRNANPNTWRETFNTNFFSVVDMVNAALPSLRKAPHPSILFVSTGAAVNAYTALGAYGASKAALNHFAQTINAEEGPKSTSRSGNGIIIVAVRPGVVATDMLDNIQNHHAEKMNPNDAKRFTSIHEQGEALSPDVPGHMFAGMSMDENLEAGLSGQFLSWDDARLAKYVKRNI